MQHLYSIFHDYALPFLLVIGIVVFVHEFGHYWVARRCGIKVVSFSIGFGKPIFSWTDKHGTKWQVAWLPLGGYVKMFGDADPASSPDEAVKNMTEEEKKVSFFHQSVNKRMAVVVAGPAFNYIFAILALSLLFMVQGQSFSPAVVGTVQADSAAAVAGLQPGDRFVSLDNEHVSSFEDVRR
jgi:regulator of sigma E protease